MKNPNIIKAKFLRSGNKGKLTKPWETTDTFTKNTILGKIELEPNEVQIICFYSNANGWLLTSKKIWIFTDNLTTWYSLDEIEKVELKKLFNGEVNKLECKDVQLYTKSECIDLVVEIQTWPIIFSILQFAIK